MHITVSRGVTVTYASTSGFGWFSFLKNINELNKRCNGTLFLFASDVSESITDSIKSVVQNVMIKISQTERNKKMSPSSRSET